jgi:hypothetical protein
MATQARVPLKAITLYGLSDALKGFGIAAIALARKTYEKASSKEGG